MGLRHLYQDSETLGRPIVPRVEVDDPIPDAVLHRSYVDPTDAAVSAQW